MIFLEDIDSHSVAMAIFAGLVIVRLLRIVDIFILRLHEVWGEILLSKALGSP